MKKRAPTASRSGRRMNVGVSKRRAAPPRSTAATGSRKKVAGRATGARAAAKAKKPAPARSTATRRSGKTTINHDQIRRWAEARGGTPATVKSTARSKQAAGVIRLDFPGYSGKGSLKPISWDEWFDVFEQRQLALVYQDKTAAGKPSRFNKLVTRK